MLTGIGMVCMLMPLSFVDLAPSVLLLQEGRGMSSNHYSYPYPIFQINGLQKIDLAMTEQSNKHVIAFQDYFLRKWPMVFLVLDQDTSRITELLT